MSCQKRQIYLIKTRTNLIFRLTRYDLSYFVIQVLSTLMCILFPFKMCSILNYLCIVLVLSIQTINCSKLNTTKNYEDYFNGGVEAYLDEKWQDCITNMETSIHLYKLTLTAIADCRLKCHNDPFEPLVKQNIEDLHFYDKMVKKTLCFLKCKRTRYPNVVFDFSPDASTMKKMEDLIPYTYLHICYFYKNLVQKAASAAFTFLVENPEDKKMRSNLEYYLSLPEVDAHEITNYEAEEFLPLYLHGINAYNNKDWESVIAYMEDSIHAYFTSEERCRVLCEGSFDPGWLPDFTSSVSNHFTYCLKCKQGCADKLKLLNNFQGKEILGDQYNYLQIAYNNMGRVGEACRCVASYLLIYPSDETMLKNKQIYSEVADITQFTPRPEIVHYLLRENYEQKLLNFINTSFVAEFKIDNQVEEEKQTKDADINNVNEEDNEISNVL